MRDPQDATAGSCRDFSKRYYDQYVLKMTKHNRQRTGHRVETVLRLLGDKPHGRLLTIGAGNLVEPI